MIDVTLNGAEIVVNSMNGSIQDVLRESYNLFHSIREASIKQIMIDNGYSRADAEIKVDELLENIKYKGAITNQDNDWIN